MVKPLLSEDSIDIIQKSIEDDNTLENVSSRTKRDFVHFIRDFGILKTAIGFIIANVLLEFIKTLVNYTLLRYIGIKNKLFNSTLNLLVVIFIMYLFVQFIFYKHIYTKDISKEEIIKNALTEKKIDEVKKKFDKHQHIRKAIDNSTDLSSMNQEIKNNNYRNNKNINIINNSNSNSNSMFGTGMAGSGYNMDMGMHKTEPFYVTNSLTYL